jgi:EAL domain-containing protein (putative c-di-GMP-specific phosphodiesterase class I)
VCAVTLVPGPWSPSAGSEQEAVASLLARPDAVRSVQQPVVDLRTGLCAGYSGVVRIAEWVGRESGPWFRAAADAGLRDELAGLALQACLRARATMPGERFLITELSGQVLAAEPVACVLADQDDVADVVLSLTGELGPGALAEIERWRTRGLRFAATAGSAGLADLEALTGWRPEVVRLPARLVRGLPGDPLRQRLVALVVGLTADLGVASADGGVLAEDVETLAEVTALRDLGVRWAQGWLVGRLRAGFAPPAVDLQDWLTSTQQQAIPSGA